jgi:hypothetical protein
VLDDRVARLFRVTLAKHGENAMVVVIGLGIDVANAGTHVEQPGTFLEMAHDQRIKPRIARPLGNRRMEFLIGIDEGFDADLLADLVADIGEPLKRIEFRIGERSCP